MTTYTPEKCNKLRLNFFNVQEIMPIFYLIEKRKSLVEKSLTNLKNFFKTYFKGKIISI